MDNWKVIMRKGAAPGSLASLASTAVLALFSKKDAGSPFAGANAISHWLWGDRAFEQDHPTLKYTLVGYGIHHASSHFWGSIFEQRVSRSSLAWVYVAFGVGLAAGAWLNHRHDDGGALP